MNAIDAPAPARPAPVAFAPASAAEYRRTLQSNPADFGAWFGLAGLDDFVFDAAQTSELERLYALETLAPTARIISGFALARALEDQGRYAEAFSVLGAANSTRRRGLRWDAAEFSRSIDATMQAFSNPPLPTVSDHGGAAIFLVGMPCAGADIVERMLGAHADVEGTRGSSDLGAVIEDATRSRNATFAAWAEGASGDDWQQLGERHEVRTAAWRGASARFIDNALSNWRFVGAIAAALPGAHIVEVTRDPLETCLGCYRRLFAEGQFFSYDVDELIACWRDYAGLMRFWHERHPGRIHQLSQAQVIADPTTAMRGLLAYCGLPFDEACVAAVPTIPPRVNEHVTGYGGLLMPLRLALGMAPA